MHDNTETADIPPTPQRTWPITVAGWLWMVTGVLIAVMSIINLGVYSAMDFAGVVGAQPAGSCWILLGMIIGAVLVHIARSTLIGTTSDTLGNGIGSIAFGLFFGAIGMFVIRTSYLYGIDERFVFSLFSIGLVNCLIAMALEFAGILAISARTDYRAWRETLTSQRNGN